MHRCRFGLNDREVLCQDHDDPERGMGREYFLDDCMPSTDILCLGLCNAFYHDLGTASSLHLLHITDNRVVSHRSSHHRSRSSQWSWAAYRVYQSGGLQYRYETQLHQPASIPLCYMYPQAIHWLFSSTNRRQAFLQTSYYRDYG
jgi:hypothetical protein